MQLIQYAPTTEQVHRRPLMIMPPWINKFYILDLQPKNSFIKFCVDQGYTVFVLSWVNPDEKLSHKTLRGLHVRGAAGGAGRDRAGDRRARGHGHRLLPRRHAAGLDAGLDEASRRTTAIKAATFFTTLVDFNDPGELGVFIDEEQLAAIENAPWPGAAISTGAEMATTFNMLRANDLIWSFVINNYLLGKDPFPFDLLYWNSDSTRMPAAMHSFYLRKCYHENALVEPGGISLGGVPIDLRRIDLPVYWVSTTRGSHRALEEHLRRDPALPAARSKFVLAGLGPHRRRGQPAGLGQIRLLDQRRAAGRPGGLARGRPAPRGLVVGRLGAAGTPVIRGDLVPAGSPAPASCRRSRTPRAPTSRARHDGSRAQADSAGDVGSRPVRQQVQCRSRQHAEARADQAYGTVQPLVTRSR